MSSKNKLFLFCLITLLICNISFAGKEKRSARLYTSAINATSSSILVNDDKFTNVVGWNSGFYDYANTVKVEFGLDEDKHIFHNNYFYAEIKFDIQFTNAACTTLTALTKTLTLDYQPGGGTYKDKSQFIWNNYYKASITNMTITAWDSPAKTNTVTVPSDLYLNAEISTDRIYPFSLGTDALGASDYDKRYLSASNEVEIYWDFFKGAEEYELEWQFIDNYDGIGGYITSGSLVYDLRHDATRIITSNNYYRIPLTYERGYIVYRIRPIGRNNSNEREDGEWTIDPFGDIFATGFGTNNYYYNSTAFSSDDMNWKSTLTFAEFGKQGAGINYLDALSFNRQSIARLNSEEKSIVQSTLYDHFGRPAINLLPAPISGLNFSFVTNLNKTSSSTTFDKRIFDLCINNSCSGGSPTYLDTANSTGAAKYYSGSNPNLGSQQAFLPSALGIPYTQIKYKKDPLGRIAEQTLPGSLHTLGSTRSITYEYTKPSQVELDRLFGSEAGKSLHYEKHFVKDPNGQLSASYIDMYGRTIGTALYGDAPSNVNELDNITSAVNLTDQMALMNQENNNCLEVNSSFFVAAASEQQTFTYTTNIVQVISDCATDLCLDCQYDLFISIKDECGHEVFYDDGVSEDPVEFQDTIGAPTVGPYSSNCPPLIGNEEAYAEWNNMHKFTLTSISSATNIVVTFPHPGVYHVQKKLCVSDQPLDEYLDMYLSDNSCHKDLCDFIDSLTNATSFKSCTLTCESCTEIPDDYSTARAAMIAGDSTLARAYYPPLSTGEMSSSSEDCENFLCDQKSLCKAYKTLLMADFYPGGLYGATTNTNTNDWDHSIFNSSNPGLGGYSWLNPPSTIKDPYGNTASVNYLGTPTAPQALPNYSVFLNNWDDSWAEAFLPLHPDYCKMKLYCEVLEPSIKYDYAMQQVDYYDDACSLGFIYPFNPTSGSFSSYPPSTSCSTSNQDPTFTTTSGTLFTMLSSGLKTAFNASMLNYTTTPNPNIYKVASQQILGSTLPTGHTFGSDVCFADMEWIKFRELYLNLKQKLYMDLYTSYTTASGQPALCNPLVSIQNSEYIPNHISYTVQNQATLEGAYGNTVHATSGTADSLIGASIQTANCDTTCRAYASLWAINIAACPAYTLTSADSANMINDLIEVCKRGCDPMHPWGSTDYPTGGSPTPYVIPGSSPPVTAYSFQDVLNYYLPPGSAAFACDANAISLPSPYNTNGMGTTGSGKAGSFLSDCGCDQILQVDYDFTNTINVPSGITSARKLFNYRYNTELKDFNNLLCVCKSALATTWAPGHTWTTPELNILLHDSVFAPQILKCNTCVSCAQVEAVVTSMSTDYGFTASNLNDVTTFIYANPQVALNNFNNTFNLNNGLQDYIKLIMDCRQFNDMSTQYTFSNALNPEAAALQLYLNDLAGKGLLAVDHDMTFCSDQKYFMSDLYTGPIPSIGTMYYDASISGGVLTIQLKATPTSSSALCTIVLTLGTGTSLTWGGIKYLTGISAYAPSPSPGPVYGFMINVSNGSTTESATGSSTCYKLSTLGSTSPYGPVLCPLDETDMPNECQKKIMQGIIGQAQTLYDQYLDSLDEAFRSNYMTTCLTGLNESFTRNYDLKEYHYTLYYYDQAGNLTRTVPPNGVNPLSITSPITGSPQYPVHSSSTFGVNKYYNNLYQFNSFNEPLMENTVDGGQTNYFYDLIGRIVASQNAKQLNSNAYSYTFYDTIGRIIEVGEVNNATDSSGVLSKTMAEDLGKFISFVTSGTRTQVIHTYYDKTAGASAYSSADSRFSVTRSHLPNRVSSVTYEETNDNVSNTYDFATHYNYDEHGNVIETIQENVSLDHLYDQRYKRTDYEFELISGNLKKVTYQGGTHLDQFMHRYDYDADNRLKEVFTSHDGVNWDKDAKYIYFEHGPLARVETGEKKVQSQDYFYTIHGWIKAMNSNQLAMWTDPGKDGASTNAYNSLITGLHQYVAHDVASYNLNYYVQGSTKDYVPVKSHNSSSDGNPMMSNTNISGSSNFNLIADGPDLYNGNISSMVTGIVNMDPTIKKETSGLPLGIMSPFPQIAAYQYDQLHRIEQMKTFREFDATNNEWVTPTTTNYNGSYLNQFTYDPNGNILSQYRNGASPTLKTGSALNMDDLTYSYLNYSALKTNKLLCVSDNSGYTANYSDDVDDQSSNCVFGASTWLNTNYDYDATGNLIADSAECIKEIEWTVDRKVKKITRSEDQLTAQSKTLPDLEYLYDANRRRICKIVKPRDVGSKQLLDQPDWSYTYYSYDASGNVIATYARTFTANVNGWTDIYDLQEYDIYGSKRLGLIQDDAGPLATRDFTASINHNNFVNVWYDTPPSGTDIMWDSLNNVLGKKQYELTNHLGNVITVVSDRKIPAALSNANCTAVYDMETQAPPGTITENLDLSVGGGSLTCTFKSGFGISGTNFPLGNNLSTSTVYQVDFDFDPGTVDVNDGLYIVMYDYCPSPWAFYMGPYVSYSLSGPAHYSFTYTPTAASPCFTTYIAFNSSSTSTHYFKIDNLTMCPVGNIPIVGNYHPEVLKTADYYPFGMEMPGRKYTAQNYRYGFNGQEHDAEVFAGANTAEYWMYDARLGRRWEKDPLAYETQSPYVSFNNNPIFFSDPLGLEGEDGGDGDDNNYTRKTGDKTSNPNNTEGGAVDGEVCSNPDGSFEEFQGGEWTGKEGTEAESQTTPVEDVRADHDKPSERKADWFNIRVGGTTGVYSAMPPWIWPVYNSYPIEYYNSPFENEGFKIDEPDNYVQMQARVKDQLEVSFVGFKQKFEPFENGFKYEGISNLGLGVSWTSKIFGFKSFNFSLNYSATFGPTFAEPKFDNAPGFVNKRPNISGYSVVGYGTTGILRIDANIVKYMSLFTAVNFHQFKGTWVNTSEGGQRLEHSGSISIYFGAGFNVPSKK